MSALSAAAAATVTVLVFAPAPERGADRPAPAVREIALEEYVARVVASETIPGTPPAALQAQAVVSRSYALAARGRHEREGADLCNLAHCQVLRGSPSSLDPEHLVAARVAAENTAGVVLRLRGGRRAIAEAPFHAACGGHTADPRETFGGAGTGAAAVPDAGCPLERWSARVSRAQLDAALALPAGAPRVAPAELDLVRGAGGWIVQVRRPLAGAEEHALSGDAFARALDGALDWGVVKSNRFELRETAGGALLAGGGIGHGVGLCQRGAARRALAGETWEQILAHYFPDAAAAPSARPGR